MGVLVVDDDARERAAIARLLRTRREVFCASGNLEARQLYQSKQIGVAIVDAHLGHESGIDLLFELRLRAPGIRTCLLTGASIDEVALEVAASGVSVIATKPISPLVLIDAVDSHSGRVPRVLAPRPLRLAASDRSMPLAELERVHILETVRRTGGNKAEAARQLGISRQTLHDKLAAFSRCE